MRLAQFATFATLTGSVLLAGCQDDRAAAPSGGGFEQPAARIVAWEIAFEREETRVETVGTARARTTATLYPETGGEVTEVLFSAGQLVEAGQPLLRLEAREEILAERLAEVAVEEAEQLLSRYRRIENTGAVSDSQIDEARTALDSAQLELERARNALAERTIEAPFTGHLGISDIDAGARITTSTEIARLDDRSVLLVDFDPPEQVFGRLREGDSVTVYPFAEADGEYQAEVISVDTRIDPTRRTFTVRAALDNSEDRLRPGMSFRVVFAIQGAAYPAVPEAAIIWGSDGSYLWRVEEGRAYRTPVSIVERKQGRVLVRADLEPGDLIVAEGVQRVREGGEIDEVERRRGSAMFSGAISSLEAPE